MHTGIIITKDETKRIIAKYFGINKEDVIPTKYSFMLIGITEEQYEEMTKEEYAEEEEPKKTKDTIEVGSK